MVEKEHALKTDLPEIRNHYPDSEIKIATTPTNRIVKRGYHHENLLQIAACAVAVFTALSSTAMAQSSQPYSGMQGRPIKALSDQEVADLKAGRGMGLALAAELNGYPGPSHLLELSEKLGLTSDQHSALKGMFDAMKAETIPIGEDLIVQEERLDRLFAEKTVSERQLKDATRDIGDTQARLRNAHLSYHLQARAILQASQINRYAELRGYSAKSQEPTRHKHHYE